MLTTIIDNNVNESCENEIKLCGLIKCNYKDLTKKQLKNKLYYEKNKKKLLKKRSLYYERNKNYISKQQKRYYNQNKLKILSNKKSNYIKNQKLNQDYNLLKVINRKNKVANKIKQKYKNITFRKGTGFLLQNKEKFVKNLMEKLNILNEIDCRIEADRLLTTVIHVRDQYSVKIREILKNI